ncbi:MAG: hypothetical protein ABIA67_05420 [Candidatus Margulisiibacteriota bacterium]
MLQQGIAPITPNMGGQEAAVAGSSAAIFTASDRKLIEEMGGGVNNKKRAFINLFKDKPLTAKVENEESNVQPHQTVRELEENFHEHRHRQKHSALSIPREKVEISNKSPDNYEEEQQTKAEPETSTPATKINEETAALAKEIKFNPDEIFDKFTLEQKELHSLISRIKELHLKRLFTNDKNEFKDLTEEIKKSTLRSAKAEAKDWLEAKLDILTLEAAKYKLGILKALQLMEFDQGLKATIHWLEKTISRLSKS